MYYKNSHNILYFCGYSRKQRKVFIYTVDLNLCKFDTVDSFGTIASRAFHLIL